MIAIRILRIIRWTGLAVIVLLVSGIAFREFGDPQRRTSTTNTAAGTITIPEGVTIGGAFKLIDDKGHAVTDADYRGRWAFHSTIGAALRPNLIPRSLSDLGMAARLGYLLES